MPTYPLDFCAQRFKLETRHKDGKQHRYWSVVESRRVRGGRVVQRHLLHLGELNDSQRAGWVRTIETLTNGPEPSRQLALFPDDRDTLPELTAKWCASAWTACDCAGRDNSAPAGWRCIACSGWTSSGHRGCRPAARGLAGRTCSKRWSPTA